MSEPRSQPADDTDTPTLGPVACAVLLAKNLDAVAQAYEEYLQLSVSHRFVLDRDSALGLGLEDLAGSPSAMLAGSTGRDWLMIVEHPGAADRDALGTHGWLAQEVLVMDVDALAAQLADSPFEVLRPPADLDVSDRIRACQARGPAGEILYLTQVKGEVPPFELPQCEGFVDHLFIPVLSTPDREATLTHYETIARAKGLRFDTRITVINQALGLPLEQRHPVGTLQLAGNALIEVDHISAAVPAPEGLSAGTAAIVFHAAGRAPENAVKLDHGPFAGKLLLAIRGIAGERSSLLYHS